MKLLEFFIKKEGSFIKLKYYFTIQGEVIKFI